MEKQTITFDELIYLFENAYAVDMNDRVMLVSLDEGEEEGTYEIYIEDDAFTISREDNEEVQIQSDGLTFDVNIRTDGSDDPEETSVRFLTLMKK